MSSAKPSRARIAAAQAGLLPTLPNLAGADPAATCWACGFRAEGFAPERAHLVAAAHGGPAGDPTNYVLLCEPCHRAQPDGADVATQLAWLRAQPHHRAVEWDRIADLMVDLYRMLATAAGGDAEAIVAWHRELGDVGFRALVRDCAAKAAGTSNVAANAKWGVVAAFEAWRKKRGASHG